MNMDYDQYEQTLRARAQRQALHRFCATRHIGRRRPLWVLCAAAMTAPMVTDEPMDGEMFLAYVRKFSLPDAAAWRYCDSR